MTFYVAGGERRKFPTTLVQRLEVGRHVCGLSLGQAENGHKSLRLHGSGRLNPANKVLGVVLKFAGNKCAARNMSERGPDYSVGIGYSGNHVAGSASELPDHRLSTQWRAGDCGGITGNLLSSDTTRNESASHCHQARGEQKEAHTDIRCGLRQETLSSKLVKDEEISIFCHAQRAQRSTRRLRTRFRISRWQFAERAGWILGLVVLASFFVPACLCQQIDSPPPDGRQIFAQRCARCHGEHGEGISAAVTYAGPSLQAEHNAGNVMMALEVGPEHMPRFQYVLSGDEMRAVSQYVAQELAVIPLSGGNVGDGGELYRTYCVSCHGHVARGGALGYVGTNAPSLEHKSTALLAGAIRWGPGPMPSFPSSVLSDRQVASIVDYIRVMQQPPSPGGNPLKWYGPTSEGFAAWVVLLVLVLFAIWTERGGQG